MTAQWIGLVAAFSIALVMTSFVVANPQVVGSRSDRPVRFSRPIASGDSVWCVEIFMFLR